MAMESRLLQASGVASPRTGFLVSRTAHRQAGQQQGFRVAAQRFMRGVELRQGARGCARRGRRVLRSSESVVVAARRPAVQEQQEVVAPKNDSTESIESIAEAQGNESSYIGSPLLWIGVGVGPSALFLFGANQVKRYAMQQMLKSMTAGAGGASPFGGPGASPFGGLGGNPFASMPMPPPGSQFPFPMPPPPAASPPPVSAAAAAPPVDVAPTSVTSSQPSVKSEPSTTPAEPRKSAFTDVNASDILEREQQKAARFNDQAPSASEPTRPFFVDAEVSNSGAGAGPSSNESWTSSEKGKQTVFSVEQLEKMMEDPTVQKMFYPYLSEEMRSPTTFKWMMQNPQYRQQLEDMLNNMGGVGDGAWDNRISDMLKNFDLNSTEVKQQFEQNGLTPEEVVAKIMANPEIAVAFQNLKIQADILDCSTNPLNITKYLNDKEVMDVFNKISGSQVRDASQARLSHKGGDFFNHVVFAASVSQFARNMGKALALGVVIAAVGFGPKVAVAAPAVAEEARGELEEEEELDDELSEAEIEEFQKQEELKKFERERQLRFALGIDQKVQELEALGEQAARDPAKKSVFLAKIEAAVRGTYAGGRQLQGQKILELNSTIEQLKKERDATAKRAERMEQDYLSSKSQLQKLDDELDDANWEQREVLESAVKDAEARSGELWQKVSDLEMEMMEKKTWIERAVFDDLPKIEDQAKAEFESVYQRWIQRSSMSEDGTSETVSRVVKELEVAGETHGKQSLLPLAVGVVADNQSPELEVDAETQELIDKIQKEQERGVELRARYESLVRDRLGVDEDADISHVRPPVDLGAMDLPTAELDVDPSETGEERQASEPDLEWAMGWRAWREKSKEEFKQYLQDNPEEAWEYVKEKQAAILVARDRVMAETWFNKQEDRWEMSPMGASHAVTRKLVAKARVRHDRRVMYLTMKGDDREYLVDIPAMNAELEAAGGFDSLYIKMSVDGVPTTTEFMWIPLKEWPVWHLFQLPFKVVWWVLEDIWNSPLMVTIRPYYFQTLAETFEEIMVRFGFSIIQAVLPLRARVALRFDLPEGAEVAEPTDIMVWQQEAQRKTDARYGEGTGSPAWWISLPLRTYVVGIPLYFFVTIVGGLLLAPFTPRKLAMNEAQWKEKKQEQLEKEINRENKKDEIDPIKNVFDKMKRVKHPQVKLQDFAGIDAVKEEINEVISFLRNPKVFKEMGARPPRGVLIVGGPGTGKTTLAFAIAAEAKVPMVELQGAELEGGAWVGQGASNVRELFKTAREVSPLIIFMDDFDHFAGVRGATSDTRKQDHESLINQLLVELDGFETQEGVVLIATTSRPYAIDEALRRPGRMDRTIQLPMPNVNEREQILRKVALDTMDPKHVGFVDWAEVADKTAGLTPAQLNCVPRALEANAVGFKIVDDDEISSVAGWLATFNQLMPMWFKKTKLVVKWNEDLINWLGLRLTKDDLETAVETMDVFNETRPGVELENPPVLWTREYKFPHAVWAAGRALTAYLLPNFDRVDQAWLDPTSWEGIAFTKLTKQLEAGYQETGTMTRSYYEKSLVLCFGPYIAGRLLLPFGQNNNLSRGELENAEEIAAQMVMQYGWGPDDSPLVYVKHDSPTSLAMGDEHEMELANKIQKLYHIATDRCGKMLQRNQHTLVAVVEHLLEYDCVTTKDLARITAETGAVFEEDPFELVLYSRLEMSTNGTTRVTKTLPAGASAN